VEFLRWGLVPYWAKDPSIGHRLINARSETLRDKPAFRDAFKKRRCIVPADGFYEWKREGAGKKQPHLVRSASKAPFALAGLWERWRRGDEELRTCVIITRPSDDVVGAIHDRMPVTLDPRDWDAWLDPELEEPSILEAILGSGFTPDWRSHTVSTLVNSVANDSAELLIPDEPRQRSLFDL
jgi:putative SOS response-associated peptidase YedK